ncbi:MAG: tyrosine-type recombinase/integrase, partial [Syntrophomonadaceae bacterium]|nr:tyrosine-type recombinase/integrase [Syntrophomonadaceae bacterium]
SREKTKTKSSKRKIILDVETLEYLKELKQQQSFQVVVSLSKENDRLVFSENGKPIRHRAIQLTLKRALKKGELPDIGIHNIRHSVVSILADEGVSLGALLSLTGHSNLSSADPYYHRTKEGLNIIDTLKQKAYK